MDHHWGVISQSVAGLAAALFTALSWVWIKSTGEQIKDQAETMRKQTEAVIRQTELNNELLRLESNRDKQSNMISAYLIAEIEEVPIIGLAFGKNSKGVGVTVTAVVDNQSLQPVFEIVAVLFKRKPHMMGKITLTEDNIPVSVVGPKTARPTSITEYFVRDQIEISKTVFNDMRLAQHLAKQIEIEYLVLLNFRDSNGIYWVTNPVTGKLEVIDASSGTSKFQNALNVSIDKLQRKFTDPTSDL